MPPGTFQYTQPTSEYNELDSPFVNTDGSFTTLTTSTSVSSSDTIVSWFYEFNDSGTSSVDGLYLQGGITTSGNMKIISFGGIPLSRQGFQFRYYSGTFPDDTNDIPTILESTSGRYIFSDTLFSSGVGNWNVENITTLERAFLNNPNFNEDLNNWNVSNVINMYQMFQRASSFNKSLNNWNTSNVLNMAGMFSHCSNFNGDISNWNTSNVSKIDHMFASCLIFNKNVNTKIVNEGDEINEYIAWDVSNVIVMRDMFRGAKQYNQPMNEWKTDSLIDTPVMFRGCSMFNQDLSSWNISNVNNMLNMLDNSALSVENYNNTLNSWSSQTVQPNIELGAQGLKYSNNGKVGRDILTNETNNWTIQGDSLLILLDGIIYDEPNYLSIIGYDLSTFPVNGIVYLHPNAERILESAFKDSTVTLISIPSTIIGIDDNAFKSCSLLEFVSFKSGSTCALIGNSAFDGCSTMEAIIIPQSVTTVGNQAFDNCTQLTRVTMYKSNILYIYTFTESSDKTLIIQTFLSSSVSELDEGWVEPTVISSPVTEDTDVSVIIPTITGLSINEISTLVATIFEDNSALFNPDESKISFSAPGELFSGTVLANVNPDIASQSVTVFSSEISDTIAWSPTTTANAYVLLDNIGSTITITMDDGISVFVIKGESTTSVTINDGDTLQYTAGDTFNIGTTTCIIGSFTMYTEIPEPIIFSNICVRGSELVRTDNMGYKPIAALSVKDTLQGQKIQRIYRTRIKSGNLVLIKKNALGLYRPFKDTVVTKNHKVKARERLIPAGQLITSMSFPDVVEYKYNGEILYNVLMVNHNVYRTMNVNGLVCETLSRKSFLAKPTTL
jgi:surface protein